MDFNLFPQDPAPDRQYFIGPDPWYSSLLTPEVECLVLSIIAGVVSIGLFYLYWVRKRGFKE